MPLHTKSHAFIKLSINHLEGTTNERFKLPKYVKQNMDVKVEERVIITPPGIEHLFLKTYIFNVVKHKEDAAFMLLNNAYKFDEVGQLGIAFLYEYPQKNGYINGADVFVYRGTLEELERNSNPMIHSWTIENGKELHRSKDGTLCTVEAIILGKEAELIRNVVKSDNPKYTKFFEWPEIDIL